MTSGKWRWTERIVDRSGRHIVLTFGGISSDAIPIALVGPPSASVFPVEFIFSPRNPDEARMLAAAKSELDSYLVNKGEEDPWKYALYHCTTAANLYSSVHWSFSGMKNWNGEEIEVARSKGGVIVTSHPYDNLIRSQGIGWPPCEIVQKLCQSRQERAFEGPDAVIATKGLGYYCDLQSLHSEDAITWSVFGTLAHSETGHKQRWLEELCSHLHLENVSSSGIEIDLWRRVPHPDTLCPGGPELDFSILTSNAVILGEAKWLSKVGDGQGKKKDKDQIQLRVEFLQKFKDRFFPGKHIFVVLGVSLRTHAFKATSADGVQFVQTTWEAICSLLSHPQAEEIKRYYNWKKAHTKWPKPPDLDV